MRSAALGTLIAGALAVGAPPAQAGPAQSPGALGALSAVRGAPPGDDATASDRPVQITVGRLEPRSITPGSTITVTGTLTNTGTEPISALGLRLQRGAMIETRAELAAVYQAGGEPDATAVEPAFQDLRGELQPGAAMAFSYAITSADLGVDRDGVYPVLLNVNGTVADGERRRVGELSTVVVQQPVVPAGDTTVAWLWPLVEPSHRAPSGGFADDGLAQEVSSGGRLDRALEVIERLPTSVPPGGTEPVPVVPVTLAVDPALVEELTIMAAGPYAVDGVEGAGRGTEDAQSFLQRLRTVAAVNPVVALSYGDVDADSLTAAGLSQVVARSLPGSPAGTAQDPPGGADAAVATDPSVPATGEGTTGPDAAAGTGAGERILADALGVDPRTDLAWAAGGSLRPDTAGALQAGGIDQVVLAPAGLSNGDTAVAATGGAAAARATVPTADGSLGVLVAAATLGDVVGSAEDVPGGPRMAEQRYLAELAVLDQQAPAGSQQTVLVAAPREVSASLDGAGAMMADTGGLPWLRPGTLDVLSSGPETAGGELADPADALGLDTTGLTDLVDTVAGREDLAGAVVDDPDVALQRYDAAIARASSATWRSDPDGFRSAVRATRQAIDRLRKRVTLLAPADGTYSLASSDAPLVLTVRNDLPFAVSVRLDLRTRGHRGLVVGDIGRQVLAPGERTTLQVPTEVRQSGGFAVTAALTTPSGGALGDRVEMQVKSTAYGPISLLITIGASALLGLLFLRRLVLFLLRRRRAAVDGHGDPSAPEGAAVSLPPTRSPV